MSSQGGPDVGFFHFGSNVQIVVVPQHFRAGPKTRTGLVFSLDIEEPAGPGRSFPCPIVKPPVDKHRFAGPETRILPRHRLGDTDTSKSDEGGEALHDKSLG